MAHESNQSPASRVPPQPSTDGYAPSAMPSTMARAAAFSSIVLGGLCGGVIGYALIALQYDSTVLAAVAAFVGAVVSAVGVAVVATLALRAMTEWRVIEHSRTTEGRERPEASG